jgi:hypothetical protein
LNRGFVANATADKKFLDGYRHMLHIHISCPCMIERVVRFQVSGDWYSPGAFFMPVTGQPPVAALDGVRPLAVFDLRFAHTGKFGSDQLDAIAADASDSRKPDARQYSTSRIA